MAMGQMEGIDDYDFVLEINIPDEVMQHMQKITLQMNNRMILKMMKIQLIILMKATILLMRILMMMMMMMMMMKLMMINIMELNMISNQMLQKTCHNLL